MTAKVPQQAFRMLIGGRLVEARSTLPVINPATGKVFASAPACSQAQVDEAVHAARHAFPTWAATQAASRRELMQAASEKVLKELDSIAEVLVKEQGKPLRNAKSEMQGVVHWLKYYSRTDFELEKVLVDSAREKVVERRVPLGVVGGIIPWNFPLLVATWKMSAAIATGNTIVLKPSPHTPLSTLMLGEVLVDTFPPGVLNVVSGDDEVGRWLTEHDGVSKISFTGSVRTGKAIQAAASSNLKRLTLELGGNDAAIVLEDADAKAAAKGLFNQSMANTGQVCVAVKRAYVHESKFQEVVSNLTALAEAARSKVGDGLEKGTEFGPIATKMQFDRVNELVEDAKKRGAKVHAGGEPMQGEGYFYPPTILTNVKDGVRVVDEEQFGPVLPVMPFTEVADAVRLANTTPFGLGGSVWGQDEERAAEVGTQLHVGTVWINSHGTLSPDVPFGGLKESGLGRQSGAGTLEGFTQAKVVRMTKIRKLHG